MQEKFSAWLLRQKWTLTEENNDSLDLQETTTAGVQLHQSLKRKTDYRTKMKKLHIRLLSPKP